MATDLVMEQRLAALEAAVADIRHRIDRDSPASDWIERFRGAFKDEPAFAEVVEYGRAIREADRPVPGITVPHTRIREFGT